jgi:tRNA-modifying protein YgfZ
MEAATIEIDGQYRALREGAGLLDRSRRGMLGMHGGDAADFLQGQLTNDVEALAPGEGCYAALLDRKGHMQGDMRVLRVADDEIWLDTEAAAAEPVRRHLETYRIGRDVEVADLSGTRAILSLVGPGTAALVGDRASGAEHSHAEVEIGGVRCRAVTTDLGIDLIAAPNDADALRAHLVRSGAAEVSEEAVEIARVETGRPRFGAEMTNATIPAEAGINDRAVSFTKGCYIGQETVARLHYKGRPNRHLRGLRLSAPAAAGDPLALDDREVGTIGTACLSPALGPIGLAIVRREAEPGDVLTVAGGPVTADVVELPFRR